MEKGGVKKKKKMDVFNSSSARSSDLMKHVFAAYKSPDSFRSRGAAQGRDTHPVLQPFSGWRMAGTAGGCWAGHLQLCTERRPSAVRAERCRMSAAHRGGGRCITEP